MGCCCFALIPECVVKGSRYEVGSGGKLRLRWSARVWSQAATSVKNVRSHVRKCRAGGIAAKRDFLMHLGALHSLRPSVGRVFCSVACSLVAHAQCFGKSCVSIAVPL